jgi:hypothetical protein
MPKTKLTRCDLGSLSRPSLGLALHFFASAANFAFVVVIECLIATLETLFAHSIHRLANLIDKISSALMPSLSYKVVRNSVFDGLNILSF